MKFQKPNFWDKSKVSIWPYVLLPISYFINLINFFRKIVTKRNICPLPVICVGNIYVGGTGKTPLSIEISLVLKKMGKNPFFIKKKYPSHKDEALLLAQNGNLIEDKSRLIAIDQANRQKADVVILDDGFQDFTVQKDLAIICFHEKQWIGNGMTIPSGPLREKLTALKRANCVIINGKKNISIEKEIMDQNKSIKIFYSRYELINKIQLKDKKVIAFAGIGNPINFFDLLKKNNINVIKEFSFPDHYNYRNSDLEVIHKIANHHNAITITTEKDYLRLDNTLKKNINYLKIKIEIEENQKFVEEISKVL